jgi:hypothetical protein
MRIEGRSMSDHHPGRDASTPDTRLQHVSLASDPATFSRSLNERDRTPGVASDKRDEIHDSRADEPIARFTPEQVRRWRTVLTGLTWMRTPLIPGLVASFGCVLLAAVMDNSDRAFSVVLILVVQAVLGCCHGVGLLLCCLGPAESETRRQARHTDLLLGIGCCFLVALAAFAIADLQQLLATRLSADTRAQIYFMAFCSSAAFLALIGRAWMNIHATVGRELEDPGLATRGRLLANVWCGYCVLVPGACLVAARLVGLPGLQTGVTMTMSAFLGLCILQCLHLNLLGRSRQAIRMSVLEPWELHPPGGL